MQQVVDPAEWPVLAVRVGAPSDLEVLADELGAVLAREERFALQLTGPPDLAAWHDLLWAAPAARRRLRRLRAALAAWCELAAHVVEDDLEHVTAGDVRLAELIWGCQTVVVRDREQAAALLRERLGSRNGQVAVAA